MTVDFRIIRQWKVSLNEFTILALLSEGRRSECAEFLNEGILSRLTPERVQYLVDNDLLQMEGDDYNLNNLHVNSDIFKTINMTEWEEFLNIYPKKEGNRSLHNNKTKCKQKYMRYITTNNKYSHEDILRITSNYVKHKDRCSDIFNKTGNREYWIEAYPLLSTFINNLEDRMDQYKDLEDTIDNAKEFKFI